MAASKRRDRRRNCCRACPRTRRVAHHPGALIMPGFIDPHIHYPQTQVIASYGAAIARMVGKIHLRRGAKIRRSASTRRAMPNFSSTNWRATAPPRLAPIARRIRHRPRRCLRLRSKRNAGMIAGNCGHEPQRAAGRCSRPARIRHRRQPRSDPALARHRSAALRGDAALCHHLDRRSARSNSAGRRTNFPRF